MSALPLSSASSLILDCLFPRSDAASVCLLARDRNRKQEFDRHSERAGNLLMQRDGTFAFSSFKVRQVALSNADLNNKLGLSLALPLTQDADGIFAARQTIDDDLGQHDLGTGGNCGARLAHNPGRTDILIGSQSDKPIIFPLRQNGEFLAVRGLDELHFGHNNLSIINFTAMPDGCDDDGVALGIEDNAPVTHTQPRSCTALEPLHIAVPSLGKDRKLGIDSPPHVGGKPKPLARSRAGKRDLHSGYIAYSYIKIKAIIAQCNMSGLS